VKSSPILVAILGGSGAGKTWITRQLQKALPGLVAHVALDDFYRDRSHLPASRRAQLNYDHPRAIDWPALQQFLAALRSGHDATIPQYDFATHCRTGSGRLCERKAIVVVEGLWLLLRREIRALFDFSVYVDCPEDVRLQRRLTRDVHERGRTAESVTAQFVETVAPMHKLYVAPQAARAAVRLRHPLSDADVRRIASYLRVIARLPKQTGELASLSIPLPRNVPASCAL
jgi:uridine kinase